MHIASVHVKHYHLTSAYYQYAVVQSGVDWKYTAAGLHTFGPKHQPSCSESISQKLKNVSEIGFAGKAVYTMAQYLR